jgi:transcriptional regulator with XRE-family HTH domain
MTETSLRSALAALGAFIRAQRLTAGLSLRDLAARTGVSNAYLSQVERGLHEPSITVLRSIADALELPLESLLARAGVLDRAPGEGRSALVRDTEAAILQDPELSEPQRVALRSVGGHVQPPPAGPARPARAGVPDG